MANTADMIRLMRHGAELLSNANPPRDSRRDETVAAMSFAEALLRMVSAAMDDEPEGGES